MHIMIWDREPEQQAKVTKFQQNFNKHFDMVSRPNCTFGNPDPAPHQKEICAFYWAMTPEGPFNNA